MHRISIMLLYALKGVISKGDIYTDIAFMVEMYKCFNRYAETYL